MYLVEVKKPEELKGAYDYFKVSTPFRPNRRSGGSPTKKASAVS
jgi:hypothetical protein